MRLVTKQGGELKNDGCPSEYLRHAFVSKRVSERKREVGVRDREREWNTVFVSVFEIAVNCAILCVFAFSRVFQSVARASHITPRPAQCHGERFKCTLLLSSFSEERRCVSCNYPQRFFKSKISIKMLKREMYHSKM
jgi:hypothetical protein